LDALLEIGNCALFVLVELVECVDFLVKLGLALLGLAKQVQDTFVLAA
jgi:hypothetical protein